MLLWVFASVVVLIAQCVIVWKAYTIFNAVVARETEQQDRVVRRLEELFAEQRGEPERVITALLEKMQQTYLDHLDAVHKKHEERYEKFVEQTKELQQKELQLKDERIRSLTLEADRLRK